MPTTTVPQISEENLEEEQMVENANELEHSENHHQGNVDFRYSSKNLLRFLEVSFQCIGE